MVLTATSMNKGESSGKLVFFERDTFKKVVDLEVGNSHVVRTLWHPRLNQVTLDVLRDSKKKKQIKIFLWPWGLSRNRKPIVLFEKTAM
jgi:hypothetical protein